MSQASLFLMAQRMASDEKSQRQTLCTHCWSKFTPQKVFRGRVVTGEQRQSKVVRVSHTSKVRKEAKKERARQIWLCFAPVTHFTWASLDQNIFPATSITLLQPVAPLFCSPLSCDLLSCVSPNTRHTSRGYKELWIAKATTLKPPSQPNSE